MKNEIYGKIKNILDGNNINYREIHHEPTRTSMESAEARGEPLEVGGKSILLKVDDAFMLFVLSASLKIDSRKIKKQFKAKNIRFATPEELNSLAGLEPGAVPPFGRPVLPFELYIDNSILKNSRIAFNAGTLTDSIVMSTKDYFSIANPAGVFNFSKE